jgi:hypothetical protein
MGRFGFGVDAHWLPSDKEDALRISTVLANIVLKGRSNFF